MASFSTAILLLLVSIVSISANPDEMKYLPGMMFPINFKQYSGYLEVGNGKHLHYWFVESQRSPSTDPLLLWLNGGPGCSSLDGFLAELGPFKVENGGYPLSINNYSWNKVANVLFLESPAGVGFSYSDSGNYSTDDDTTAEDNYHALQNFFTKYPQFRTNDFYITGESYGGIYIPTLSVLVLNGPEEINFKGFAIGNGYLDVAKLGNSVIFFAYHHGLIEVDLWNTLVKFCCNGNASRESCNFADTDVPQCMTAVQQVQVILQSSGINPYNIYDECRGSTAYGITRDVIDQRNLQKAFRFLNQDGDSPPCTDPSAVSKYLNSNHGFVRLALHVPPSVQNWTACSTEVESSYRRVYTSMTPQIMKLINSGKLRGLIYNGDVDSMCNFLGDEWFAKDLGLETTKGYRPWLYDKQIAGFVKEYGKLQFVTIKGSGHMVPHDKPGPALHMIKNFLLDEPL